jgi:hypothetical protein
MQPFPLPSYWHGCGGDAMQFLASTDKLLAQRIAWLETLQRKRQEHVAALLQIISTKQLEIDNLKAQQR